MCRLCRAKKRMDGEDVFGYKIRVQFADAAPGASPGPPSSAITGTGSGSPKLSNGGSSSSSSRPRKSRRDRNTCSASASRDSGVKLSSSDDNDGVGEDAGPPGAPADLPQRPAFDDSIQNSLPTNGDDVVVCGPVEEIDVDVETPTKDVNSCANAQTSAASEPLPTPSKKTKTNNSQYADKSCKHLVPVIFIRAMLC